MIQAQLSDVLNDCIDRLADGDSIEDCLRAYPEWADELRPLLELGLVSRLNRADAYELGQMHNRLDHRIENLIAETDFDSSPLFHFPQGMTVLAASLVFVFIGVMAFLSTSDNIMTGQATETPTPEITATTTLTLTATHTQTPTPMLESTNTELPIPTAEASHTEQPIPTTALPMPSSAANTTTCFVPDEWVEYRIQSGDTLSLIAVNSGTTIEQLREANCLDESRFIVAGATLYVPTLWETSENTENNTSSSNNNSTNNDNRGDDHDDNDSDDDDHDDDDSDDDDHEDDDDD